MHYLAKVPRGTSLALEDGIRIHQCLDDHFTLAPEEWMRRWPAEYTGKEKTRDQERRAKTAALAVEMVRYTPAGKDCPVSEDTHMHDEWGLSPGGTTFYIKPDLHRDRSVFVDWKSTSAETKRSPRVLQSPSFWEGEPPKEILVRNTMSAVRMLKDDIQANLYAHGLMQLWDTDSITGLWVYGCKKFGPGKRPKVWTVEHTFTRAEARDYFEHYVVQTAMTMNTIRMAWEAKQLDTPLLVPHNGESCEFVGKFCDALGYCAFADSPIPISKLRLPVLPA